MPRSLLTRSMRASLYYNHAEKAWYLGNGIFLHRMYGSHSAHIFLNPKIWRKNHVELVRKIKGVCPTGKTGVYSLLVHYKGATIKELQTLAKNAFVPKTSSARWAKKPKRIWIKKIHSK